MVVTINTDASFNYQYKIGAYAYWLVANGERIKKYSILKECEQPLEAELKAIANALYRVTKSTWRGIQLIVVNTDCKHAIEAIRGERNVKKKGCINAIEAIHTYQRMLKEANQIDKSTYSYIDYRHVKAHSDTKDSRTYVNNWCDNKARSVVRNRVAYLKRVAYLNRKRKT